jgi:hypothetical protein
VHDAHGWLELLCPTSPPASSERSSAEASHQRISVYPCYPGIDCASKVSEASRFALFSKRQITGAGGIAMSRGLALDAAYIASHKKKRLNRFV